MATSVLIHWAIVAGIALIAMKLMGRILRSACRAAFIIVILGGAIAILAPHSTVGRWILGSTHLVHPASAASLLTQVAHAWRRDVHWAEHLIAHQHSALTSVRPH